MASLSQPRPRLAPALFLSWILSVVILILIFGFNQYPRLIFFQWIAPIGTFVHSSYFLTRLWQSYLRPAEDSQQENDWPRGLIFPGKTEKLAYLRWAVLSGWNYLVAWGSFFSGKATLSLRWPDDRLEIFARVVYILALITSITVAIQAYRTRRREDLLRCSAGHKWVCSHCGAKSIDEAKNEMPVHSSSLHPERVLKFILGMSVILNGMIIASASDRFEGNERKKFYLLAFLPGCNILHHTIRIIRVMASSKRRRGLAAWPATPIFESRHGATLHHLYMVYMLTPYLAVGIFMLHIAGLAFWRGGHAQASLGMLWFLEMIVLLVGAVQALRIRRWENKARCVQSGHQWKCNRLCTAKGKKAAKGDQAPPAEKTTEEV